MADKPKKDHWSSLLETIGLTTATPDEAPEPVETTPEPVAVKPVAKQPEPAPTPVTPPAVVAATPVAETPKPAAAKKPAKTSGHWGKLAGMLGLSVAQPDPEPEPEPVAEPTPAIPSPVFAAKAPVAERTVAERPAPAPSTDELPPDLFAPPARSDRESRPAPASRDRDRGDRGRPNESRPSEPRSAEPRRDARPSDRGPEREPDRGAPRADRGRGRDDRNADSDRRPPRREESAPRRGFGEGLVERQPERQVEDWPPETHAESAAEVFEQDDFVPTREAVDRVPANDDRLGFDRPAKEGDEEGGDPRRRRRRRRGGRRPEETTRGSEEREDVVADDRDLAPVAESYDDQPFVDDDIDADLPAMGDNDPAAETAPHRRGPGDREAGGEDRGPRRRRRRRRGGSQREDAAEGPRSAPPPRSAPRDVVSRNVVSRDDEDADDDFEEVEAAPAPPASRGRPQRDTRRAPVPDEDDEVDEMLQAELEDEGEEGHAHKKIPTWQDTVGVLIDGNMSMRSERPESRGNRGRRPPHRGR